MIDSQSSPSTSSYHLIDQKHEEEQNDQPEKLALLPLIFLIYFEVAGGPYGEEPAVKAAGPLLAILGFLIFPFIWSIPEALITAELSTTFPGNGGYVIWANHAFGPFWGSLMGSLKFFCGVINIASYPLLCIDYLELIFPIFSSNLPHFFAVLFSTLALSFLNYTGLSIIGYTAIILGILSISPFVVLTLISIPKIRFSRWLSLGQSGVKKDWTLFFNTLFWNLNFWDNVSTLAGEVKQPQKTYPKALLASGIFTCLSYLIPLMAATGSVTLNQTSWVNGYFAEIAEMLAGKWLKIWVEIGAVLSAIGLFEAQLSSCAYQIIGMSNLGFCPKIFGVRSKWFNTPYLAILISTLIALSVSYLNFTDIISSVNFLYGLGMLLEFASFIWLRKKYGDLKRPYKVPLEKIHWLILMCLVPSCFLVFVMVVATKVVYLISFLLTFVGVLWYFFMGFCKSKQWFEFSNEEDC